MSEIRQPIADPHTVPAPGTSHDPQDGTQPPSTSTRPGFSFRQSTLRVGHTHRGFGRSKKAEAPEPQSAPILVFGEVSAPLPSNCEHQGPGKPAHLKTESDEQEIVQQSTANSSPSASSAHLPRSGQHLDTPQEPAGAGKSSSVEATTEPIAKLEVFSPISAFTLPPPSICVSGPAETSGSLETRAILSTSAKSSKMMFWGSSSSTAPVPAVDELPTRLPANLPAGKVPTDALLPGDLLAAGLPRVDLPNVPVPPLQLEIPAVPSVINEPDDGPNPPHAMKRMRHKLKQKARPRLANARKLVLKKKILSVILGKELTAILEPHLNAVNGLAEHGGSRTAPVPL